MLIREATDKDLTAVLELLKQIDGESDQDMDQSLNIWSAIKKYPYYKLMVAEEEGRIVGTFSLMILDNLGHHGSKLAVVESVVVHSEFRSQGIGKQMMEAAMERAKGEKCYKLMLSSNKKRVRAHKFYEELGFEQHGISFAIEVGK
ncbi:MAG: GNAT family N-acetyltransferase [Clostridia bacterium]|nr:GNAT family N-acetyltransferase [Clostridia bacterium]